MSIWNTFLVWVFVLVSTSAWSSVFVYWTGSALPPAKELGLNDLVLSWNDSFSSQVKARLSSVCRGFASSGCSCS